jgi:hypothetical protein
MVFWVVTQCNFVLQRDDTLNCTKPGNDNLEQRILNKMVCALLVLYTPSWCWYRCPDIGTSSIDWAQLSTFYLKTETESSLRNVVF